jgi:protein-S-isoprenylcysteine O-methyltransferase Ste14
VILRQAPILGMIYLTFFSLWITGEVFLLMRQRATTGLAANDRRFTKQALLSFIFANVLAVACLALFRQATFATIATSLVGLLLMATGPLLRWWAILVAVANGHRVIDTGPYRRIRHPSYTGLLMMCLGVGLCFGNYASLVVIFVPMVVLALKRMRVEETSLANSLGDGYRSYMSHTKRLIPGIY